jgi:CRP/FNR family transcriptional regulator, anaerobic regulatory protein
LWTLLDFDQTLMVAEFIPPEPTFEGVACTDCRFMEVCRPRGVAAADGFCLTKIAKRPRTFQKGESIYRTGMRFNGVNAIKSGSMKLVHSDNRGREAIIAILLPGELAGFDGLYSGHYRCSLIALETSSACEIAASEFEMLTKKLPALHRTLMQKTGEQIERSIERLATTKRPAEERLAGFLVDLSQRYHARGFAADEFYLNLTRQEIGDHLGVTLETVCRILSRFENADIIDTQGKFVRIKDLEALKNLMA